MRRSVVLALCGALAALGAVAYLAGALARTLPGSGGPAGPARVSAVKSFQGTSIGSFPFNESAPGAVREAPDPIGGGEAVFRMTVGDGDVFPLTPTVNPRAELPSPDMIHRGQEFWWSAKFLLPSSFPASVPDWMTVLQGPYGRPFRGTPPWHIEINHRRIQWSRNRTYDWDVPWQMPLVRGRWVEVLLHCRFSAHGFIEMWVDGRPATFFAGDTYNPSDHTPTRRLWMRTMDTSNDGAPNHASILSYRKAGMFRSVTIYQGPTALGPTRRSVELPAGQRPR
jgi:Polysaccharide lyase